MVNRKSKAANFIQNGSLKKQLLQTATPKKNNTKPKKRRGIAITWETAKSFFEERDEKRNRRELKKKLQKEESMIELSCFLKYTGKKIGIKLKKSDWKNIQEGGYYEKVISFYSGDIKYFSKWIFKEGNIKVMNVRSNIGYLYDDSINTLLKNI